MILRPTRPKTTDGMPTSSSVSGWKTRVPNVGFTSTTKIALPSANGSAMRHESRVTLNEPAIMGSAPTNGIPLASFWCGFQLVPAMKLANGMPSVVKVASPRDATMKMSVSTSTATSRMHAPVMARPLRSIARLGRSAFPSPLAISASS